MMTTHTSWGRYPLVSPKAVRRALTVTAIAQALAEADQVLPYGAGRSQGDSCQTTGVLLDVSGRDHFLAFDEVAGILRCEGGVLLTDILSLVVPRGWFLPVTPGTKYVTVAGAIANDVHGKSHHRQGTFGCHIRAFELLRSDGQRYRCSAQENRELYEATIGGLGLTGIITWAELVLRPVTGPCLTAETIRFRSLAEFFTLADEAHETHEYTVGWVDSVAQGRRLGQGVFFRGNHSDQGGCKYAARRFTVPFDAPDWVLNPVSMRLFNALYYWQQHGREKPAVVHYEPFFYPLDWVLQWNRLYGKRGFVQYQCVIPPQHERTAIAELLQRVAASGQGSFLTTLKRFGSIRSPGMLSFPRLGTAIAFDIAMRGEKTLQLLDQLDKVTAQAGGALYPAKDSRMSSEMFRRSFPRWQEFTQWIDPKLNSHFWERVRG